MKKVTVVARFKAKAGMEEKARQELMKMVEPTRRESGCLNYDLHVDCKDSSTFLFYENWISEIALDNHCRTEHFLHLRSVVDDLFVEPASVDIMKMITEPE